MGLRREFEQSMRMKERGIISFHLTGKALWERMERAVQRIQERMERTATALGQAGVPYAIIGDSAVRAWWPRQTRRRFAQRATSTFC